MIEALARYFEEHGFTVYVLPGRFLLRKLVDGNLFGIDWAIDPWELKMIRDPACFFLRADAYIAQVDAAVAALAGAYAEDTDVMNDH